MFCDAFSSQCNSFESISFFLFTNFFFLHFFFAIQSNMKTLHKCKSFSKTFQTTMQFVFLLITTNNLSSLLSQISKLIRFFFHIFTRLFVCTFLSICDQTINAVVATIFKIFMKFWQIYSFQRFYFVLKKNCFFFHFDFECRKIVFLNFELFNFFNLSNVSFSKQIKNLNSKK